MNYPSLDLREALAPKRTALLVIDVQNDFGHRDGVMGQAGVDLSRVDAAVDRIDELARAARTAGATVVFIGLQTTLAKDSPGAVRRRARMGRSSEESKRVCREGTWGAQWYRIAPQPGDLLLDKCRYSSFQDTELDAMLKARGVDTIIATGLTTECCVETTVRDAYHIEYNAFVAADACASYGTDLQEVAIKTMRLHFAIDLCAGDIIQTWEEPNSASGR